MQTLLLSISLEFLLEVLEFVASLPSLSLSLSLSFISCLAGTMSRAWKWSRRRLHFPVISLVFMSFIVVTTFYNELKIQQISKIQQSTLNFSPGDFINPLLFDSLLLLLSRTAHDHLLHKCCSFCCLFFPFYLVNEVYICPTISSFLKNMMILTR